MKLISFLSILILAFSSCKTQKVSNSKVVSPSDLVEEKVDIQKNDDQLIIAFGSCNDEDKPQKIWNEIIKEKADLWIWLGDNIYGDSKDMSVLKKKYAKQNSHKEYIKFKNTLQINGTWDDHDYGVNDGGKDAMSPSLKKQSQELFFDFIDVPKNDPRRNKEGIYGSQELKNKSITAKVIYLDTRYFRDDLYGRGGSYKLNTTGSILGAEQWKWLESELKISKADVHIFVSSIQVIAEDHKWEKWGNFPNERTKFLDLIAKNKTSHPIILSGDRHTAEISEQTWKGVKICDVTSSGLTNVVKNKRTELNTHRVQGTDLAFTKNYGTLEINMIDGTLNIVSKIKSAYNTTKIEHIIAGENRSKE